MITKELLLFYINNQDLNINEDMEVSWFYMHKEREVIEVYLTSRQFDNRSLYLQKKNLEHWLNKQKINLI